MRPVFKLCLAALAAAGCVAGLQFGTAQQAHGDPFAELALLQAKVQQDAPLDFASSSVAAANLDALGDKLAFLHRPVEALAAHTSARSIWSALSFQSPLHATIASHAAIATDLRVLQRFKEAVGELQAAQGLARTRPSLAALLDMESVVHECAGDAVTALSRFEMADKIAARESNVTGSTPPAEQVHARLRRHIDLLTKVLRGPPVPPATVQSSMQAALEHDVDRLIDSGLWTNRQQLPAHYVPGLASSPWHDANEFPGFPAIVKVLEDSSSLLVAEYAVLQAGGHLERDQECLHVGGWHRFSVNAPWQQNAIEAGTWIQPHYGHTNAQLKLHLGLVVPVTSTAAVDHLAGGAMDTVACAHFRVGSDGPPRPWVQGSVLLFDDSYSHEAWNNCTSTRVVFQVVVSHPDSRRPLPAVLDMRN